MARQRSADYAVLGLGRLGSSLARRLEELGQSVLAIDIDRARVQEIAPDVSEAVVLDATDPRALEEVDITSFPTVIVAIADNFQAAVLVTATLKQLGIARVIGEARTEIHQSILERLGADRVVRPLEESGSRLADELVTPGVADRLPVRDGYDIAKLPAPTPAAGRTVASVEETGVTILLVVRDDRIVAAPEPEYVVHADDDLVILGNTLQLAALAGTG